MPIYQITDIDKNSKIGMWELTEDHTTLLHEIENDLFEEELEYYESISALRRKSEWLATRLLLKEMFQDYVRIVYDSCGKPTLSNGYSISISHSCHFVVVLVSDKKHVGTDIEVISDKIAKIAVRFLNNKELEQVEDENKTHLLYINWCAKETLYKVYGLRNLNFKEHLHISPVEFGVKGQFKGAIKTGSYERDFSINYQFFDYCHKNSPKNSYVLTWCCE